MLIVGTPIIYFLVGALTPLFCVKNSYGNCSLNYNIISFFYGLGIVTLYALISLGLTVTGIVKNILAYRSEIRSINEN